jgi:hypothetical protein
MPNYPLTISLSGLGTIRAYGEGKRFIRENTYYMDLEDRAYLLTAANARWLSVRLDFLGGFLVFAVAIMAAKGGGGLTSAQIALCLTYLVSLVQLLGLVSRSKLNHWLQVTRQSAEVENNSEPTTSNADMKWTPWSACFTIPEMNSLKNPTIGLHLLSPQRLGPLKASLNSIAS